MFRLTERQLHLLFGGLFIVSILLFCVFGIRRIPQSRPDRELTKIENFSDGWVCTYYAKEEKKSKESTQENKEEDQENQNKVVDILNLPAEISVEKGKMVLMTHKIPEQMTETAYLLIRTKQEGLRVYVGESIIYSNSQKDTNLPASHVVSLPVEYSGMEMTVEFYAPDSEKIEIETIQMGSYGELLLQTVEENGTFLLAGSILILFSVVMLILCLFIQYDWGRKKIFVYAALEGLLTGIYFTIYSEFIQVITDWSDNFYLIRACLLVIMAVLHLMLVRCFTNKKKVLVFIDVGILAYIVFYIAAMVLQAFSLFSFAQLEVAGIALYGLGILVYTIVLAVAVFIYHRAEGKTAFVANGFFLLGIIGSIAMNILGAKIFSYQILIPLSFGIYLLIMCLSGFRKAIAEENGTRSDEYAVRQEMVEQFNPNLVFASLRAMQNLVKKDTSVSLKVLYYLSVYIRDNLKSIGEFGEEISFETELEHILAYLQLQKLKSANLEFVVECKEKEFVVPRGAIEQLVEKAVKYGITKNNQKGKLVIRSYQRQEEYAIQIIDDGVGFDFSKLKKNKPTSLKNILSMLEEDYQAKTEVISRSGKGTVITIVLPMI